MDVLATSYDIVPVTVQSSVAWTVMWTVLAFLPIVIILTLALLCYITNTSSTLALTPIFLILFMIFSVLGSPPSAGPNAHAIIESENARPVGVDACDIIAYRTRERLKHIDGVDYITAHAVSEAVGVPVGSSGKDGTKITGDGNSIADVRYLDGKGDIVKGTLRITSGETGPWKAALYGDDGEPVASGTGRDEEGRLALTPEGDGMEDAACAIASNSTMKDWDPKRSNRDYDRAMVPDAFHGISILKNDQKSPGVKYTKDGEDSINDGDIVVIDRHYYLVRPSDQKRTAVIDVNGG